MLEISVLSIPRGGGGGLGRGQEQEQGRGRGRGPDVAISNCFRSGGQNKMHEERTNRPT